MSTQQISLALEERTTVRKRLPSIRKNGMVPAIIHNHGKDSIPVAGDTVAVTKMYQAAGKSQPIYLTLGGKKHLVLVKHVDYGPVKHDIRHVVFQSIRQNEEVDAEVPLVFKEDAEIPAEKKSLIVLKQVDTVQVKALPKHLPEQLVIDPSVLSEVGDHLRVSDINLPDEVTLLSDPEQQVAIVEMPKDQIAEADAAAESLAEDAGAPAPDDEPNDDETAVQPDTH